MKSMIALFALLAVASAVDYYGTGLLHKNQRWNKDIWNGVGYGSVIGGYGVGLPQTYGQQIYGQSYYNPISYAYGVKPQYTYGYVSPIHQQYGVQPIGLNHQLGSYGRSLRVEPVTHNTYASVQPVVQPIVSKTISTVVEPQVQFQGKSFISQQPAFTSYFHRGAEIVKPEISAIRDVADVTYTKTVQQPINYVTPQLHVQPQYVSSFKTVQEPAFVQQYTTGWQDASLNYDVPKVSTYSSYEVPKVGALNYDIPKVSTYGTYEIPKVGAYNYEIPKVGAYNYEIPKVGAYNYEIPKVGAYNYEIPKVSGFSYSNTQAHVVEPKVTSTHTVTQEDYKK